MANMSESETIMTLEEIAKYLKISMSQMYNISREPEFPRLKLSTWGIRVRKSDLDKWLESKKVNN